jgi:hypothetical protein
VYVISFQERSQAEVDRNLHHNPQQMCSVTASPEGMSPAGITGECWEPEQRGGEGDKNESMEDPPVLVAKALVRIASASAAPTRRHGHHMLNEDVVVDQRVGRRGRDHDDGWMSEEDVVAPSKKKRKKKKTKYKSDHTRGERERVRPMAGKLKRRRNSEPTQRHQQQQRVQELDEHSSWRPESTRTSAFATAASSLSSTPSLFGAHTNKRLRLNGYTSVSESPPQLFAQGIGNLSKPFRLA